MLVLVTYDVNTIEAGGKARLRSVAKACRDFGQRVQFSVFEIEVDPAQWTRLKARLEAIIGSGTRQPALLSSRVELAAQSRTRRCEARHGPRRYSDRLKCRLPTSSFEWRANPKRAVKLAEGSRKNRSLKS